MASPFSVLRLTFGGLHEKERFPWRPSGLLSSQASIEKSC